MIHARLDRNRAVLLIVDIQEKLLPAIFDGAGCVAAASKLIAAAGVLGVRVIATEQYPAGLGPTCAPIKELLKDAAIHEKTLFSGCTPDVVAAIGSANQVIVAGMETHVCVQQTVLDLLRAGKDVWVCVDAVSSRRAFDRDTAIDRMRHEGACVTTGESAIFELLGQAGTPEFKQILKIVK